MGMFDTVDTVLYCPFCGEAQPLNYFQTKDFDCTLEKRTIYQYKSEGKSFEIHNTCIQCNNWISINVEG